jgi:hypothetical protein
LPQVGTEGITGEVQLGKADELGAPVRRPAAQALHGRQVVREISGQATAHRRGNAEVLHGFLFSTCPMLATGTPFAFKNSELKLWGH